MFSKQADVRIHPEGKRILLTPIKWAEHHGVPDTRVFTAQAGMIHDGASIPSVFGFLNGPSVQLAATLHDAAYRKHVWDNGEPMTRWEADLIILWASKAEQLRARRGLVGIKPRLLRVSHFCQRWIIFLALLPVGGISWRAGPSRDQYDHEALDQVEEILKALKLAAAVVPTTATSKAA